MMGHPFGPGMGGAGLRSAASRLLMLDEDEVAELLRSAGYSEHAIEQELAALRDYRERMAPPPVVVPIPNAADRYVQSAARKRRKQPS